MFDNKIKIFIQHHMLNNIVGISIHAVGGRYINHGIVSAFNKLNSGQVATNLFTPAPGIGLGEVNTTGHDGGTCS